jgi:nuclear transport factor 2 (NTF2) superfamily protein
MDLIGRSRQVLSVAVEWADRLGRQIESYGSEGWGFESLRVRRYFA